MNSDAAFPNDCLTSLDTLADGGSACLIRRWIGAIGRSNESAMAARAREREEEAD